VDAKYLGFEQGKVKLQLGRTGKVLLVPLGALVEEDQKFVKQQTTREEYQQGRVKGSLDPHTQAIINEPTNPLHYASRGRARTAKADYDGAIRDFTKAIEFDPHDAATYNARGLAYQRKGELTAAQQDFSKAIELDPKCAPAYRNRGENLYKLASDEEQTSPELDEAIEKWQEFWNRARKRNLNHTPWQPLPATKGAVSRQAALRQMAKTDIEFAEGLEGDDDDGGDRHASQDSHARQDSRDHRPARSCSVCPYCGRPGYDAAKPSLERDVHAPERRESHTATLADLADGYVEEGRYDRAADVYSRLLEDDSDNDMYLRKRAAAHLQQGGYDYAARDYDRLLNIADKPDATLYYNRGCAHLGANRLQEAIEDFTESISLNGTWSFAYNNRGAALARLGRHDKAIENFTKAIEHEPNNRLAYRNRALAYKKLGEPDKAQSDFGAFLELDEKGGNEFVALSTSAW